MRLRTVIEIATLADEQMVRLPGARARRTHHVRCRAANVITLTPLFERRFQ